MAERPYVLLSACMSIDGYIDDAEADRLVLSTAADFDRVDAVRAGCDGILVGAATIRSDNPRLVVRSPARRAERVGRGVPPTPVKITLSEGGGLDPQAAFFTTDGEKVVYGPSATVASLRARLGGLATVVDAGRCIDMVWVCEDLYARGIRRLMVEGGRTVHTQFLTAVLADELHLVVAPVFVGDSRAPRFVRDGKLPWTSPHRARLVEVRQVDDAVLLRYALSSRFVAD